MRENLSLCPVPGETAPEESRAGPYKRGARSGRGFHTGPLFLQQLMSLHVQYTLSYKNIRGEEGESPSLNQYL